MLQEITAREAYLLYQFRNADIQKKHFIAANCRIPMTEQETQEAIELYLSRDCSRPDPLAKEIIETGFARFNEDCKDMMQLFINGQDQDGGPAEG